MTSISGSEGDDDSGSSRSVAEVENEVSRRAVGVTEPADKVAVTFKDEYGAGTKKEHCAAVATCLHAFCFTSECRDS